MTFTKGKTHVRALEKADLFYSGASPLSCLDHMTSNTLTFLILDTWAANIFYYIYYIIGYLHYDIIKKSFLFMVHRN